MIIKTDLSKFNKINFKSLSKLFPPIFNRNVHMGQVYKMNLSSFEFFMRENKVIGISIVFGLIYNNARTKRNEFWGEDSNLRHDKFSMEYIKYYDSNVMADSFIEYDFSPNEFSTILNDIFDVLLAKQAIEEIKLELNALQLFE